MTALFISRFHPLVVALFLLLAFIAHNYGSNFSSALGVLIIVTVVWSIASQLRRRHGDRFPRNATKYFSPFGRVDEKNKIVWRRQRSESRLIKKIENAGTTNIIVTGPSGAGKSTLLYSLVFKALSNENRVPRYIPHRIENYNNFKDNIAAPILKYLPDRQEQEGQELSAYIQKFLNSTRLGMEDVYDLTKAKAAQDGENEEDESRQNRPQGLDQSATSTRSWAALSEADLRTLNKLEDEPSNKTPDEPERRKIEQALAFKLWDRFEVLAGEALENPQKGADSGDYFLFAFDQLERLILNARTALASEARQEGDDQQYAGGDKFNGYEFFFFLQTFKLLRRAPTVRTIFVLRSEYIYSLYEIVEILVRDSDRENQTPVSDLFLCPGISAEERDAFNEVKKSFDNLAKLNEERTHQWQNISDKWDNFVTVCQMGNRSQSNTFIVQLFGYLLEVLGNKKDVLTILNEEKDKKHLLSTFFDYLISDFIARERLLRNKVGEGQQVRISPNILLIVLYAVAVENRIAGQAISMQRIQALSHVPKGIVTQVIEYLNELKVLTPEAGPGSEPSFRIVHEQISDYIIESERFKLDGRTKEGIRGLSEIRTPTIAMVRPERLHDPLTDLFEAPSISVISIWVFNIYGLLLTLSPQFCKISEPLFQHIWLAQKCDVVQPIYWARFVMESSWVAYIYVLSASSFFPTSSSRIQKVLAVSLPTVGSILGVIFSHSPVLFLVPLCVCGYIMAFHLMLGKWKGEYKGKYADECYRWGYRTGLNMVFTMLLMGATFVVLFPTPEAEMFWGRIGQAFFYELSVQQVQLGWVILSNAFMLWFLLHIFPDQASSDQIIRRLVEFDRTKTDRVENRDGGQ